MNLELFQGSHVIASIRKTSIMQIYRFSNLMTLALAFLALLPKMECQRRPTLPLPSVAPRPLCPSQFALANYACAMLPTTLGSPPLPPLTPPLFLGSPPSDDHDNDDDDNNDDDDDGNNDGGGNDNNKHNNDDDSDHGDDNNKHRRPRRHGHRHGHQSRHIRQLTPQEENCCRWIREVDSQCVCEVLVRLPPFLVRPGHRFILQIGDLCHVIYTCGGPI